MAVIPLIMVAGAAIGAMGAMEQAKAAKAAAGYNAQLRERDARVSLEQAAGDAHLLARRAEADQGSLLAGYGASGVSTSEGSPVDVLRMSVANAKLDEGTLLYKGRLKATGYYDSAVLDRMGGKTAEEQGNWSAASSLLTGIGSASYTYTDYSKLRNTGGNNAQADAEAAQQRARKQYGTN